MREASISESALTLPAVKRGMPASFIVVMCMSIWIAGIFAGFGIAAFVNPNSHLTSPLYPSHQVRNGGRATDLPGPAATSFLVRFEGEGR
ncbi:MAG: hypothetical protein J0H17_01465 [Rhizobiales bacterium]|nr:hypothetical protein [Hyphomicrobiales bacterium]